MTDVRERRIATLTAAAKVKSQTKTDAAEQAIRRLASPTPSSTATPTCGDASRTSAPRTAPHAPSRRPRARRARSSRP